MHKKTFYYLEQLILKHRLHQNTLRIKEIHGEWVPLLDWWQNNLALWWMFSCVCAGSCVEKSLWIIFDKNPQCWKWICFLSFQMAWIFITLPSNMPRRWWTSFSVQFHPGTALLFIALNTQKLWGNVIYPSFLTNFVSENVRNLYFSQNRQNPFYKNPMFSM